MKHPEMFTNHHLDQTDESHVDSPVPSTSCVHCWELAMPAWPDKFRQVSPSDRRRPSTLHNDFSCQVHWCLT